MNEIIIDFWKTLATGSIGVLITLIVFWIGIGRKIISRQEIHDMIQKDSPYIQDRQFIMERLSTNKENHILLTSMLQRNTEVMTELKIQIATLSKTLEALEDRIEH